MGSHENKSRFEGILIRATNKSVPDRATVILGGCNSLTWHAPRNSISDPETRKRFGHGFGGYTRMGTNQRVFLSVYIREIRGQNHWREKRKSAGIAKVERFSG
jgi:hypothetical protein